MPHAAGPRVPEYHSTDTDENRLSKTQSQRRTKAACLQKILKLRLGKAKRKTLKRDDASEKPETKNGSNFQDVRLFRQKNP